LPGTFDHIGAGILRSDTSGDPVLGGVQHVPLVTLDHRHLVISQANVGGIFAYMVPVGPVETVKVRQELVQDVWRRDEVGIEDGYELCARIHSMDRHLERPTFEPTSINAM